jgi:hypothetical protein
VTGKAVLVEYCLQVRREFTTRIHLLNRQRTELMMLASEAAYHFIMTADIFCSARVCLTAAT